MNTTSNTDTWISYLIRIASRMDHFSISQPLSHLPPSCPPNHNCQRWQKMYVEQLIIPHSTLMVLIRNRYQGKSWKEGEICKMLTVKGDECGGHRKPQVMQKGRGHVEEQVSSKFSNRNSGLPVSKMGLCREMYIFMNEVEHEENLYAVLTQCILMIHSCLPSHKTLLFLNPHLPEATDSTSFFQQPLRNLSFLVNNSPLSSVQITNKIYITSSKQFCSQNHYCG